MNKLMCALVVLLALPTTGTAGADQSAPPSSQRSERPDRPYRGLFGAAQPGRDDRHSLRLSASIDESYDEDALAGGESGGARPGMGADGFFSSANADLEYARRGRQLAVDAFVRNSMRYYPDFKDFVALRHGAGVSASMTRGGTQLSAEQQVEYAPYYRLDAAPALPVSSALDPASAAADFSIDARPAYRWITDAAVEQSFGRQVSVRGGYGARRTSFRDAREVDLLQQVGSLSYRRTVSRTMGLRASYQFEHGNFGASADRPNVRGRIHTVTGGVEYRRRLASYRWTNFSLNVGASSTDVTGSDDLPDEIRRMTADASVVHEIGRTWNVRGTYRRAAGILEGFTAPVFSDALSVALGGFMTRRLDVLFSGSYTEGTVGPTGGRTDYTTRHGSARAKFAISRHVAVYTEYLYYHYRFGEAAVIPVGLPRILDRQGVRAGVMTNVPIF